MVHWGGRQQVTGEYADDVGGGVVRTDHDKLLGQFAYCASFAGMCGWDDATTTRQPIGKPVGEFELGAGCSVSWCGWVLVYVWRKAHWIRLVAASRRCAC